MDPLAENSAPAIHKMKLSSIEAARGIAAVMVVFYHAARHLKVDIGYLPWHGISQFGHSGVDFFFVLSGFIIMFVHRKDLGRPASLPSYLERRFTRIYPYFWCSLLVSIALALLSSTPKMIDPVFLLSASTLLPIAGDVGVAWTLQHEVLFYLLFAVAIFNWRLGLGLTVAWMIFVAAVWVLPVQPLNFPVLHRLAASFNVEFFFGMVAAYVVQGRSLNWFKTCAWLGATIFVGFAIAENLGWFDGYSPLSQLAYGLGSALIVMGVATAELRGRLKVSKSLAELGSASYSIYLFHLPCIGVTYKLLGVIGILKSVPVPLLFAILTAAGIVGGVVLSRLVEYRLINVTRSLFNQRTKLN